MILILFLGLHRIADLHRCRHGDGGDDSGEVVMEVEVVA